MPPIYNNFACPPGETLTVGKFVTTPDPGMRVNINRNNAVDVDPDGGVAFPAQWYNGYSLANSFSALFGGWNGAVWCPEYSTQGAMVFFGGGHGSNTGCFAAIFNITTRLWSVVGTQNITGDGAWLGNGSRDAGWKDYTMGSSKVYGLTHQYATVSYIRPGYSGVGSKGGLYLPYVNDHLLGFSAAHYAPHIFDLETGVMSRAASTAPSAGIGSGDAISVLDKINQKIWMFATSNSIVRYIDLTEASPRVLRTAAITFESGNAWGTATFVYEVAMHYCEATQMILVINGTGTTNGGISAMLIDTSSGTPAVTNISIPSYTAKHGGQDIGIAWDSTLQKFYLYEGAGDDFLTTLKPSTMNFRTCTWTWGKEQFGGVAPASRVGVLSGALTDSSQAAWRKFHYCEPLKCLLWTDGPSPSGVCVDGVSRSGSVQLMRTPGTPI